MGETPGEVDSTPGTADPADEVLEDLFDGVQVAEPEPIPIHLVFAHARLMSPRIRVFVDWMKQHL